MKELSPEQIEKLRPEARERYEKRLKEVKRNRKILMYAGIALAAIAVILTLSMTVFFNIRSINIAGDGKVYTDEQIIMASGIDIGDNMIVTNFKKVEERIEKSLPYVRDAVITKTITGKVTITVTDTKAEIAVKTPQGYAVSDINGKVLEIVKDIPESGSIMNLKLKGGIKATVGEVFEFNDANEKTLYDELVKCLDSAGLRKHITEMDLTQRSSIKLIYQGRLRLLLGSSEKLTEKIKSAAKVIEKENEGDPALIAEINLTIPKKAFVNPVESLEDTEKDDDAAIEIINPEEEETTLAAGENGESQSEENSSEDENSGDESQDDENE